MKVFNTIVIYDDYVIAENHEDARAAVLAAIAEGDPPTEQTALEARSENNIRESWRDKKPLVGAAVSDEDFAKCKGKTTAQIYKDLYASKAPASTKAAAK